MLTHIHHLWDLLDRRARIRAAFVLLTMILTSIIEILGIGVIFPILQLAIDPAQGLEKNVWLSQTYSLLNFKTPRAFMISLCLLAFLIYLSKNLFSLFLVYVQYRFTWDLLTDYSRRLFRQYLHASYAAHIRRNSAILLRNINHSILGVFNGLMMPLLTIISDVLLGLFIFGFLIWLDPWIAIMTIGLLAFAGTVFLSMVRQRVKYWGKKYQTTRAEMLQWPGQAFSGFKQIKALGRENFFDKAFGISATENADCQRRFQLINNVPRALLEVLVIGGVLLTLVLNFSLGHDLEKQIPLIGAFSIAILRLMPSANRTITQLNTLRLGTAAMEVIYDDLKNIPKELPTLESHSVEPLVLRNELKIENVHFTYDRGNVPALHGINITIPQGTSTAIVGVSGSGKSTLADILLGLLTPTSGRILADGVNIAEHLRAWRAGCGYIPQEVFLLDDTVRRNISFGIAEEKIDQDAVLNSVKMAQLSDVVDGLPNGLDTPLGEDGVRLSGGQRQRVSIARSLYHDPDILVLDEATSALDNETEKEVSAAIDKLSGKKTLIIIAHRLSTIRHCDEIVFLDKGKLIDSGSFDELKDRNADFRSMVELANLDSVQAL